MPSQARPPLPLRRRLLFACVPLAVTLLGAEALIRLFRAPLHFGSFRELRTDMLKRNYPAARDPLLGYVPRAGFASRDNHWGTAVTIDQDGMRSNGGPTPAGERVVAAVGDSFTFGDQVDDDASWPAQLERSLGQPVKNGGVFGYSFTQAALRGEQMLERFPVSTLVVAFIADDLTRSEFSWRYGPVPWFDLVGDGIELRGVPVDHARPSDHAGKAWKDFFGHSALVDAVLANTLRRWWYEDEKQATVPHLAGKGEELGRRIVDRLAGKCRERGVRLLLVLQGERVRPDGVAVLRHAAARGVQTLDLASQFVARKAADPSLQDRWFDGHMTREGNGWVAEQIAAALR
jgi:hypothetical protein